MTNRYIRLDKDIDIEYDKQPPRARSQWVNKMIRAGLVAQKQQENEQLSLLRKIYVKLENGIQIQANEEKQENGFCFDGLQSMAVVEDD